MPDFFLHTLGSDRFEQLVAAICDEILGMGTETYSSGRDEGVDAFFEGRAEKYPSRSKPWEGKFVIQSKWTSSAAASCSDPNFARILDVEAEKVIALRKKRRCDNYLLFTNRKLTAPKSGDFVEDLRKKTGLEHVAIFGLEQISRRLDAAPDFAHRFDIQVAPQLSARFQLPPPPGDFTGRERELIEFRKAIESEDPVLICGLQGMGGVGKTTLALKISEEIRDRYPDGQVLVEMQGTAPEPLSATEAMCEVIAAFEPGTKLPDSPRQIEATYRSIVHDRQILLMLDNAISAEQVEPLQLSRGLMLVTSRKHFIVPGMKEPQILGQLEPGDACKLLVEIAPRIGEIAEELAELCGYLPLALRLAASALVIRRDISPERYAERLAAGDRLELIETAIASSYELLSEEHRQRFAALSVFPGGFDTVAAAAVWASTKDAEAVLGVLLTSSLVEWANEQYRLHDLVRDYAESRLVGADAYRRRHAHHYCRVLATSDSLQDGGDKAVLTLARLDRERKNIRAAHAWASEQTNPDEVTEALLAVYPSASLFLLLPRLSVRNRARWIEGVLEGAREVGARKLESAALLNLGIAYEDLGETRRSIECREQALVISREIGDRQGEGNALGSLGNAYRNLGETRRSIEFYEQSLEVFRSLGDRQCEGAATGDLGDVYADLGETRRSIEFYEKSLEIFKDLGDRGGEAIASWNCGLAYESIGQFELAVELLNFRVNYLRKLGHPDAETKALYVQDLLARLREAALQAT